MSEFYDPLKTTGLTLGIAPTPYVTISGGFRRSPEEQAEWEAEKKRERERRVERYAKLLPRMVTVGDLRRALRDLPSGAPVVLEAWTEDGEDIYVAIGNPHPKQKLEFEVPMRDGWESCIGEAVVIGVRPKR